MPINQAMKDYKCLGYSDNWINQRIKSMEACKEQTDEWQRSGINDIQYALITDIITCEWNGATKEYKNLKGLRKDNLHD